MDTRFTGDESNWAQLETELDAWLVAGRIANFWWRDDDAAAPGPRLDQLIDITKPTGLLLAVIPKRLQPTLVTSLSQAPHVHVAQHGYAHINHAPRGRGLGAWELGLHRGIDAVMADLDAGHACLESHFQSQFLPVVVPPWNRIAPELMQAIAARGYLGVSAFGPRSTVSTAPGLMITNAHCDPIKWKPEPHFRGSHKTIAQLVEHLQARRNGTVDANEATGFLTHHIDLDAAAWEFCARLVTLINHHDAAQWSSPRDLFAS